MCMHTYSCQVYVRAHIPLRVEETEGLHLCLYTYRGLSSFILLSKPSHRLLSNTTTFEMGII